MKSDDTFLAFSRVLGDPPLQWVWTADGPRIDPSDRETYLARIRSEGQQEELCEMYTLMDKYPDEARNYLDD